MQHGRPDGEVRHHGDLGNIESTSSTGITTITVTDRVINLQKDSDANIINRTIVIHEQPDNFTGTAGNAGPRIACCIVTARRIEAVCNLVEANGSGVRGSLRLAQADNSSEVTIQGNITNLEVGQHGFHVHEKGSTNSDCTAAGKHFDVGVST